MRTVTPTQFMNVFVTAIPYKDSASGKTRYKTTFEPASLTVKETDTVINYQLVEPTPADVVFKSVTVKPDREDQLSEPSISESGKLVTFSDANTKKATFNLTLHFADKEGFEFMVDPEVENEPDPLYVPLRLQLAPELENEPD